MQKTNCAAQVCRKLARGRINDAVRLLYGSEAPPDLAKLDLYNVAEIKRGEKGIEIKFFDRLKAAELLQALESENGAEPLYRALGESAAALQESGEADDAVQ